MNRSFLQTDAWAEFQRALGHKVFEYDENNIKVLIVRRDIPLRKNYLYISHGPEIDFHPVRNHARADAPEGPWGGAISNGVNALTGGSDNAVRNFVQAMRQLAKKEKAIFVQVEPLFDSVAQALVRQGFKPTQKTLQPNKTVVNDLTKDESEILTGFSHGTRYSLRVAQKNNITVRESDDLGVFLQLLDKTSQRQKFGTHPHEYYQKFYAQFSDHAEMPLKLFVAELNDTPLAAALVLVWQGTGYYLHGASDYSRKELRAPSLLHWEIMRQLKAEGVSSYDWWGIDTKRWPGVTEFKLGWGGRVVERPGAFVLPVRRLWYWLYKSLKR